MGRNESEAADDLLTRLLTDYVDTGELHPRDRRVNGVVMM